VLGDRAGATVPYVLRVEINGELQDLHKKDARHDPEAKYAQGPIARRKEATLELPAGPNIVSVRLIGAEPGDRCLVRVRALESEADAAEASLP
jgi:hypothetical protein